MIKLLLGLFAIQCPWCDRKLPLLNSSDRRCRGCGRKVFTLF